MFRWLCALLASWAFFGGARAADTLSPELMEKLHEAVPFVRVSSHKPSDASKPELRQSTGFFVAEHVIATTVDAIRWETEGTLIDRDIDVVFHSGVVGREQAVKGVLVGVDKMLAFIRVPVGGVVLEAADQKGLRETQRVFAPGFPLGSALTDGKNPAMTFADGTIASLRRTERGLLEFIQLNADINPGSLGAPVIDVNGKVVGVALGKVGDTQVGFCLPVQTLKTVLEGTPPFYAKFVDFKREGNTFTFYAQYLGCDPLDVTKPTLTYWFWTSRDGRQVAGPTKSCALTRDPLTGYTRGQISLTTSSPDDSMGYRLDCTKNGILIKGRDQTAGKPEDMMRIFEHYRPSRHTRERPVLTPPEAKPGEAIVRSAPKGSAPEPVESTDPALDAKIKVVAGGQCEYLAVPGVRYEVGEDLIALAAPPRGEALYAIYEKRPALVVLDPATLKETKNIPLPGFPSCLCCEGNVVAVGSAAAKTVTLVDAAEGKILQKLLPKNPALSVINVVGLAPDGRWMTIWEDLNQKQFPPKSVLCLFSEKGGTEEVVLEKSSNWCCFAQNGARLILQKQTGGMAVPDIHFARTGEREGAYRYPLLKDSHQDHGFIVRTFNRKQIAFPTWCFEKKGEKLPRTYLADQALTRFEMDFPGELVAELPGRDLMISFGWQQPKDPPTVFYIRRSSGLVTREVLLQSPERDTSGREWWAPRFKEKLCFQSDDGLRSAIYVPGREIFLYRPPAVTDMGKRKPSSWLMAWRCGPVRRPADALPTVQNTPPKTAKVGQLLTFQPQLEAGPNVTYQLSRGPDGMTVDRQTGRVQLTPTELNIGIYDVVITADINGKKEPILKWTLEVRD